MFLHAGAKLNTLVKEVITNGTSFERLAPASDSAADLTAQAEPLPCLGGDAARIAANGDAKLGAQAPRPASHCLLVHPRFPYETACHGCKLCPANLCKVLGCLLLRSTPVCIPWLLRH